MSDSSATLVRRYGLATAVAIIVGQVIAVGIFLVPAGMARSVGSPAWLLTVWIVMGVMTLCGAFCYAELAARFPESGGTYVFLRKAYGDLVAFLFGWIVLLVLDPGLTAIFAIGLTSYLDRIIAIPIPYQPYVAASVVVATGVLNIVGARLGSEIIKVLSVTKVAFLLFIVAFGFLSGKGSTANLSPFFSMPNDVVGAMAGGLVGAFFSFAGWWELTRIAGEIRDPERNLPRALIIGVLTLTLVYILVSGVFMYLVPTAGITSDETFAAQVGHVLFGTAGAAIFSAVVIASVLGSLVAYMMVSPRLYYAMARDGLFFRHVAAVHHKFKTPYIAISIQAILGLVLIFSGSFQQIVSLFFFVVVLFIGATVASIFVFRRRSDHDGFKAPGYPLSPLVFLMITGIVLFFIAARDPARSFIGVALVILGVPVYYLFRRRQTV